MTKHTARFIATTLLAGFAILPGACLAQKAVKSSRQCARDYEAAADAISASGEPRAAFLIRCRQTAAGRDTPLFERAATLDAVFQTGLMFSPVYLSSPQVARRLFGLPIAPLAGGPVP